MVAEDVGSLIERIKWSSHDLGHHPSPGNEISLTFRIRSFLKIDDRLQQAIEMTVGAVIELLESIETFRQVGSHPRRVVVSQ